jgi:hypothetical protein
MARMLNTAKAAEALGVSVKTLKNLVWANKITPGGGVGPATWLFSREEIKRRAAERAEAKERGRSSGSIPSPIGGRERY